MIQTPSSLPCAEFQLHVDAAGAVHVMSLRAGELRGGARVRQQALLGEIGAEQAVRVAADRIFGNAERRAEHARLGEAAGHGRATA